MSYNLFAIGMIEPPNGTTIAIDYYGNDIIASSLAMSCMCLDQEARVLKIQISKRKSVSERKRKDFEYVIK